MAEKRNNMVTENSTNNDSFETEKTVLEYIQEQQTKLNKNIHKARVQNIKDEANIELQAKLNAEKALHKLKLNNIKLSLQQEQKLKETYRKQNELTQRKQVLELLEMESAANQKKLEKEKQHTENMIKLISGSAEEQKEAAKALQKESFKDAMKKAAGAAIKDEMNEVSRAIDKYASYQGAINTRLMGSGLKNFTTLEERLTTAVGINPYIKTETLMDNLSKLVAEGINYNVEQRAFLETISENIATTFDAANASLLRIVRLQQSDSTAARLGMEAYLTRYLNSMFENTEYLNQMFDSVQGNILEASSQMTNSRAMGFEYQVQKWLGSLYSVGLSDSTIGNLSQALGYLGSGNISGLSGSAIGNLLIMAASRAGLSYSDLLSGGLDATSTNALMYSLVNYMQEIGSSSSNVVRSQFAETFGVSISDLTAALSLNTKAIKASTKSYTGDIAYLASSMTTMGTRLSGGQMINNLLANSKFSMASDIAANPILSAMWQITDMIQNVTGGINIPALSYVGTMIDLETTVENLMKLGLVGIGSLGMIGDTISGLSSSVAPASMLAKMGIGLLPTKRINTIGSLLTTMQSGFATSASTLIGNSNGNDMYTSTLNSANDSANQQMAQVQEESKEKTTTDIHDYLLGRFDVKMDTLLQMVGSVAGYEWSAASDSNSAALMLGETRMVVTAPEKGLAEGVSALGSIDKNVEAILGILTAISGPLGVAMAGITMGI